MLFCFCLVCNTYYTVFSQVLEVEVANVKVGIAHALPPPFFFRGGGEAGYAGASGKNFRIRPSDVHFEAI